MEDQQRQHLQKYMDMFYRSKILIVTFLLLAVIAGLGVYLKTEKVYESTALMIYQRARINPGKKMTPDVQAQTNEIVSTLTQQVTSRTSLERLVNKFFLFEEMREKFPMEDVVGVMRQHINIKPERGGAFKVTYRGKDPKKVMQVANALAARFIEENLRYREEKATETSAYVQDELGIAKADLDKKDAVMRDYKLKYYNEMPQQLQSNIGRLNALQGQLQGNQDSAQDLERTKILIQEQITLGSKALAERESLGRQMGLNGLQTAVGEGDPALVRTLEEYFDMKSALEHLLLRYTEKHPDVRRLQKQLASFEEANKEALSFSKHDKVSDGGQGKKNTVEAVFPQTLARDTQSEQLERQLQDVGYRLSRLKKDREKIILQIAQYEKRIELAPIREAEWSAISRDYKQFYDYYQGLVVRNLEAESAEGLERRQKGSQFKLADLAYFPEKPIKPNFVRIMALAMALGLALGGGLAFLLEMKDSSFRSIVDLESYLGVPVICALPHVVTPKEKKINRVKSVGWFMAFCVVVLCLLGGMALLYKSGHIIL